MTRFTPKILPLLLFVACILTFAVPVRADLLIDTGTPIIWPDNPGDPILASNQWLAARFTFDSVHTITGIQGYLSSSSAAGSFSLTIYRDDSTLGENIPGTELFTTKANAPAVSFTLAGVAIPDWYGASGLNWVVPTGNFWVAYEVRPGDTFNGFMANPALNPSAFEAISIVDDRYHPESFFAGTDIANLGVRVFGVPGNLSVAPEPATLLLLFCCLPFYGLLARSKNNGTL